MSATKLACLEVFALGGSKKLGSHAETPYWATRLALNQSVKEAASHLARKGAVERTAPALVRLVGAIGSRFGVVISEEVAAKALPVIGAVGGGVINVVFMNHFQQMARGHFIILRLEKIHGRDAVKNQYEACVELISNRLPAIPNSARCRRPTAGRRIPACRRDGCQAQVFSNRARWFRRFENDKTSALDSSLPFHQ